YSACNRVIYQQSMGGTMNANASVRFVRTAMFRAGLAGTIVMVCAALSACNDNESKGDKGEPCDLNADCAVDEICGEGFCKSAGTCASAARWETCVRRARNSGEGDSWMYACVDQECRRSCVHDSDCVGDDSICSDFGECSTYDGASLTFDSSDNTPGELRAGVAASLTKMT